MIISLRLGKYSSIIFNIHPGRISLNIHNTISNIKREDQALLYWSVHSQLSVAGMNQLDESQWLWTEVESGLLFCRAHKELSVEELSPATQSLLTAQELQSCDKSVSMVTKSSFLKWSPAFLNSADAGSTNRPCYIIRGD